MEVWGRTDGWSRDPKLGPVLDRAHGEENLVAGWRLMVEDVMYVYPQKLMLGVIGLGRLGPSGQEADVGEVMERLSLNEELCGNDALIFAHTSGALGRAGEWERGCGRLPRTEGRFPSSAFVNPVGR